MRAVPLRGSFFLLLLPVFPSLKKHGLLNTLPPDSFFFSLLFSLGGGGEEGKKKKTWWKQVEGCDNKRAAKIKFFFGVVVVGCCLLDFPRPLRITGCIPPQRAGRLTLGRRKKPHRLGGPFFFFSALFQDMAEGSLKMRKKKKVAVVMVGGR